MSIGEISDNPRYKLCLASSSSERNNCVRDAVVNELLLFEHDKFLEHFYFILFPMCEQPNCSVLLRAGGTQLKTTGGGQLEEVMVPRDEAEIGYPTPTDPAAASAMQTFEEGCR